MRMLVAGYLCAGLLWTAGAGITTADERKFPYEAIVEADNTYVRGGPGKQYYPTAKLKAGSPVTVMRHDPGGWLMITPPPGSFSWVPAKYVKKIDAKRGTITENNVIARVGSFESDVRDSWQQKLRQGDEVAILGEKMLPEERGSPQLWYRIAPPKGEWRWVQSQAVRPVSQVPTASASTPSNSAPPAPTAPANPLSRESDPFSNSARPAPSSAGSPTSSGTDPRTGPTAKPGASPARIADGPSRSVPPAEVHDSLDVDRLPPAKGTAARPYDTATDSNLVERPAATRRPSPTGDPRRADDGGLQTSGPSRSEILSDREVLDRLDKRFQEMLSRDTEDWDFTELQEDYRKLRQRAAHQNVQQIVDRRLASLETYQKIKADYDEVAQIARETEARDRELAELQRRQESARLGRPQSLPATASVVKGTRQFDGAGIVEHAANPSPGTPRYVLLTPQGRVLAYLVPAPGVDLEAWVGRAAGLTGPRTYRPELRADVLTVQKLAPVRLGQ